MTKQTTTVVIDSLRVNSIVLTISSSRPIGLALSFCRWFGIAGLSGLDEALALLSFGL